MCVLPCSPERRSACKTSYPQFCNIMHACNPQIERTSCAVQIRYQQPYLFSEKYKRSGQRSKIYSLIEDIFTCFLTVLLTICYLHCKWSEETWFIKKMCQHQMFLISLHHHQFILVSQSALLPEVQRRNKNPTTRSSLTSYCKQTMKSSATCTVIVYSL